MLARDGEVFGLVPLQVQGMRVGSCLQQQLDTFHPPEHAPPAQACEQYEL